MSDETTLLPCPFCGGEARHYAPGPIEHHIECTNPKCYAVTHGWSTEAQAIAAWNTRAEHGMLTAEQVREAIERNFGKVAVIDDGGEKVEWREGWVCKVAFNSQAIADELNVELGSGTCEMETSWEIRDELGIADAPEDTWGYRCSVCGDSFRYDRGIKPSFCPCCGREVVDDAR